MKEVRKVEEGEKKLGWNGGNAAVIKIAFVCVCECVCLKKQEGNCSECCGSKKG